jgi:hypothetical protein
MADSGFVVTGFTNAYGSSQTDIILLRVSKSGAVMWYNAYGNTGVYELGESLIFDGTNFVVTGSERKVSPPSPPNAIIMKVPASGGAPLFTKRWDVSNGTEVGYDIINSTTGAIGGYAITGNTLRTGYLNDPFLWRVNPNGDVPGPICNELINTPIIANAFKVDSFQIFRESVSEITSPFTHANPIVDTVLLCIQASDGSIKDEMNSGAIGKVVSEFKLRQNSPNPFNPRTTISFDLPVSGFTSIKVFDISGRFVSTLLNEYKETGSYKVTFDGTNLSSGVYYYKIESIGLIDIKKMILTK